MRVKISAKIRRDQKQFCLRFLQPDVDKVDKHWSAGQR